MTSFLQVLWHTPSNFGPGINGHVYFILHSLSPVRLMLVGNQVWMGLVNEYMCKFLQKVRFFCHDYSYINQGASITFF